jgi:LytR cell envelope-related transcriptional attenuator
MNTATRGAVLMAAAVALGTIILAQGFDDPSVSDDAVQSPTPAPTEVPTGGDDSGSTDVGDTDDGSGDTDADATDGTSDAGDGTTGADGGTDSDGTDSAGGTDTHPASEVRLLVANATGVSGLAGIYTQSLTTDYGFVSLNPKNSTNAGQLALSTVYYAEGYKPDADFLAEAIGVGRVLPMPSPPPVADDAAFQDAHVLLELGDDLASGP